MEHFAECRFADEFSELPFRYFHEVVLGAADVLGGERLPRSGGGDAGHRQQAVPVEEERALSVPEALPPLAGVFR
jgi:hypothetical protein